MNKTFNRFKRNGRTFQALALPGTNLFQFEIVNLYGSNIERVVNSVTGKNLYGIAHFIEHLGFRACKDFTTDELMRLLKTEGTYNASTDHDRINYWFKTTMQKLDIAIRLVCNYALNDLRTIPQEEFAIENQVVFNEAKRYADDDQTMFWFNSTGALCGYDNEDNVIGVPDTIAKFTHEDVVLVKDIFLNAGTHVFNITYDPEVLDLEQILNKINIQLARFSFGNEHSYQLEAQMHDELLGDPQVGKFVLPNESEQAMTAICVDTIYDEKVKLHNTTSARIGNAWLSSLAPDTSLTDIIREKHGLTYGIHMSDSNISYSPYTIFGCDVSDGTQQQMMELFVDSINISSDALTPDAFEKLQDTLELKRTMRFVNQENFKSLHWSALWNPELIGKAEVEFGNNVIDGYNKLDQLYGNYDSVKEYVERFRNAVNNKDYGIVTNY